MPAVLAVLMRGLWVALSGGRELMGALVLRRPRQFLEYCEQDPIKDVERILELW